MPLDGTLGYLLEEAGGGRDSGVAGGCVCVCVVGWWGADLPSPLPEPW